MQRGGKRGKRGGKEGARWVFLSPGSQIERVKRRKKKKNDMKGVAGFVIVLCVALLFVSQSMVSAQITANANSDQTQSQNQSVSSSGQANITTGNSVNVNPRQFSIPGSAPFAYIPSYFGPATADVNWQSVKTMVKYKLDWTAANGEVLLQGGKLKSSPKCLSGSMSKTPGPGVIRVAVNGDGAKQVLKKMVMMGTDDVWAKNVHTTTREILGQAIVDGLRMHANLLLVTGEGAAVVMKAFGWGIGIGNSVSVVSGKTGDFGDVAAGGLGVSGVEAGYHSKPWLQVLFFKKAGSKPQAKPAKH